MSDNIRWEQQKLSCMQYVEMAELHQLLSMSDDFIGKHYMEKRELFGQKFIYAIMIFWLGTEVLFSSTIEKVFIWKVSEINDLVAVVILILLLAEIVFFQKYQVQELMILAVCTLPIVYATLNSNYNRMISTWIFIIAAKNIDFNRFIKFAYYVELFFTLLVFYLFQCGVINELSIYRGNVLRHSFGFNHPNQLGVRVFLLVICRCYCRRDKFNLFDWSLIVATAIFVKRVADSKTSYYAIVILAIIMAVYKILYMTGHEHEKYSNLLIVIAAASNILSVFLSFINLNSFPLLRQIDIFMSRRFSQCHRTMQFYGVTMFGQEIKLLFSRPGIGRTYHFWLDNAYMSILLRYGIVVYLIFSILYIYTMFLLKKSNNHLLVAILCLYAIYGIMENNFFSMSQNMFLLVLSYTLYGCKLVEGKSVPTRIRIIV